MAQCPHCGWEYTPVPDEKFCDNCTGALEETPAAAGPTPGAGAPVAIEPVPGSSAGMENRADLAGDAMEQREREPASRHYEIGDKTTTVYQRDVAQDYCTYGGERVYQDRSFRCPNCGREPLCVQHYDQSLRKCAFCTAEAEVSCALCHKQLPTSQVFACGRCQRIVGVDHRDPKREEWCTDCSARWAGHVEAMEKDEVAIDADGTVVVADEVELKNRELRTKDGKAVATIKPNIWYAKPKQWYRVRPPLLRQEKQVMRRLYPKFQVDTTSEGDCFWQGVVTTWGGKEYEVRLVYPAAFPYRPPKVFVVNPKIKRSRHIYPDGHLCLFHKEDNTWEPNTTAATAMSWASLWLHCYEAWLETGHWPRKEHDDFVITTNY